MSHKLLCLVLVVVACQSFMIAQESSFAAKGTTELGGTVSYSSITFVSRGESADNATTTLTIAPQVGYFVTDGLEIGFSPGISFFLFPQGFTSMGSTDTGMKSYVIQLWGTVAYNFHTSGRTIFPFIEAQGGYTASDEWLYGDRVSGFSYGVKGGIKVVAVEHLLINISVQYNVITLNPTGASDRSGFNYLSVGVGVGGFL
jgi:hypothetical protein